ncbi:NAD(P)-dependent dehydrogenase, short-chain alcohol dehydrogenase family [Friedmanniella luteola]|uniref:NAD(P)-dependent dehydrogenase, short-chain alcohol dehydrogenase family n=1 Tax=Friedmanniella luteola TaxID=546871 RepID=A0A1H1RTB6_9ACTN|nr:oxidoreductase [Friedmanniella luteola]SDS38971.1 NAD(P)-dependent dehydrogenase, short-chain alcohol dehydrogenase family [Friedmanniella luteola]
MDLQLNGKIAVVTGASKGIGLAVTAALVGEGVQVVAGARAPGPDLPRFPPEQVVFVPVDLTTAAGPEALVSRAAELGGVDILVNNVGAVTPRPAGFLSVTDDDWVASLALTLLAAVRTTRAALPEMRRRGGGSVITISSVNAYLPDPLVIDYSAAKAALSNFSKSLSKEVAAAGIRVNTISPGPVETDLWLGEHGVAQTLAGSVGADAADIAAQAASGSLTGRFTRPAEIADLVLLLASERSGNITGADLAIDGGLVPTL